MAKRKKLILYPDNPTKIKVLYDECVKGISPFGQSYVLYAVEVEGQEFALFASEEIHEQLQTLKKNQSVIITKILTQKKNRIEYSYDFQFPTHGKRTKNEPISIADIIPTIFPEITIPNKEKTNNNPHPTCSDSLYEIMKTSYSDALKLNSEFSGLIEPGRIAISLFIARSKKIPN